MSCGSTGCLSCREKQSALSSLSSLGRLLLLLVGTSVEDSILIEKVWMDVPMVDARKLVRLRTVGEGHKPRHNKNTQANTRQ